MSRTKKIDWEELYRHALAGPYPPFPDFEDTRIQSDSSGNYPVPFTCDCADLKAGQWYSWRCGGRLSGQGSPWTQQVPDTVGRCSHEAHYRMDLKAFHFCPKSTDVLRQGKIEAPDMATLAAP